MAIKSAQSLHHFITQSPGQSTELKEKIFTKILKKLKVKTITRVIDETGDRKKGGKTDYVARQYLGSVGKVDKGIFSVNAYGIYENITFPLSFQIFKPKETLKPSEPYKTKIDLAGEVITELIDYGFQIEFVLADNLYGESSQFIKILDKYKLPYIVSIRSNYGVWLPCD